MVRPVCEQNGPGVHLAQLKYLRPDEGTTYNIGSSPRGVEYFQHPDHSCQLHAEQCQPQEQRRGNKRSFEDMFDEHLYQQSRARVVESAMNIARVGAQKKFIVDWNYEPLVAVTQYAAVLRTNVGFHCLQVDRENKVARRFERFIEGDQQQRRKKMRSIFKKPEPVQTMPTIHERTVLPEVV
jgi:hypothetical protein